MIQVVTWSSKRHYKAVTGPGSNQITTRHITGHNKIIIRLLQGHHWAR
nr:MAG TPA: hypothetical protein [Herelleviridae sp.]